VVAVAAMAAGAWVGGLSGAVFGLAAPQLAGCLWARFELRRCLHRSGLVCDHRRWWDNWRLLLGFSLPVALASVMVVPVNWLTQSWLARSGGMEEVAHFTAGNQWRMLLIFVPMQLVSASLPSLAAAHARGDRVGFGRTTTTSLAIAAVPTAALVACMAIFPAVLLGLYGPSYLTADAALVLLAWSAVPMAANIVLAAALNGAGAAWRNVFASLCYGIASLAFLLMVPHTATGLAWSQLYACCVSTLVYVVLVFILPPRFPNEATEGLAAPAQAKGSLA
jgi:O-antigen/teichoic acid export membrane protein